MLAGVAAGFSAADVASLGTPFDELALQDDLGFALVYFFAWDGQWPGLMQLLACVLFILGIPLSIKAHQ